MARLTEAEMRYLSSLTYENADMKMGVERFVSEPTVVLDLFAHEFWNVRAISPRKRQLDEQIALGNLIPINSEILMQLTTKHSVWQYLLSDYPDLPTIPTFICTSDNTDSMLLQKKGYSVPIIPQIYVHKLGKDGKGTSLTHMGSGVTMEKISFEELPYNQPKSLDEMLQFFVLPPEIGGKRYVTDVRTFIVGGKPVEGLIRRADKALVAQNITGMKVPDKTQIYSAQHRGPRLPLEEPLRSKVFARAQQVADIIIEFVSASGQHYSPHSQLGYMSIDFLIDAKGEALPVNCDIMPMVDNSHGTDKKVAQPLAQYAIDLAKLNEGHRNVMINAHPRDKFAQLVYAAALAQYGDEHVYFHKALYAQAEEQLLGI